MKLYFQKTYLFLQRKLHHLWFILTHPSLFLSHLFQTGNHFFSDETHLQWTMQWLAEAHAKSASDGVSMAYSIEKGWLPAYPETSGYIIDSLLAYGKLKNEVRMFALAEQIGQWEINIQHADGGVPMQYQENPTADVFDTGMVILGWTSLFVHTNNSAYLNSAINAGKWLVNCQAEDGSWVRNSYNQIPHAYHSKVAWSLYKLYLLTENNSFKTSCFKNIRWIFSQQQPNHWFKLMGFNTLDSPFSHTVAYTLQGFLEINLILKSSDRTELGLDLFEKSREIGDLLIKKFNLCAPENKDLKLLPGEFTSSWDRNGNYACLTGNAQFALVYLRLFEGSKNNNYYLTACNLIQIVKRTQQIGEGDPAIGGGISGSFPYWGNYHKLEYPNWAAKFFADALMLKIALH